MLPFRRSTVLAALAASAACALVPASAGAARPDYVGITSDETFQNPGEERLRSFSQMRRANVGLIRQVFDWALVEREPGVYDFTYLDQYVADAASKGIRLMPVLTNAPRFLKKEGSKRGANLPESLPPMAKWARALVERYGPDGTLWTERPELRYVPITVWQVWNEPTLPVYWGPRPNAREYAAMLRSVGGTIKRADPSAEVVTAGLPPSVLRGAVPLTKYITQLYRAGAARYFDTLAINAYAKDAKQLEKLLFDVRKLLTKLKDRRTPIWITELGWGDRGPRHRFIVGARGQAKRITDSFAVIKELRRRLKLRGVVYFSWRDGRPYAPDFQNLWGLHTGLLKVSGARKPAYRAFVRAARKLR